MVGAFLHVAFQTYPIATLSDTETGSRSRLFGICWTNLAVIVNNKQNQSARLLYSSRREQRISSLGNRNSLPERSSQEEMYHRVWSANICPQVHMEVGRKWCLKIANQIRRRSDATPCGAPAKLNQQNVIAVPR